ARVNTNTHLQAESTLALEGLGHVTNRVLNAQSGVHGPAGTIFVGERRTEEGHDPVARVLIDRPLEAVYLGGGTPEAGVNDRMHACGIELRGEGGQARHVREQHCHLFPLAFESTAGGEDLLGQVRWRVDQWLTGRALSWDRDRRGSGERVARPDEAA